MKTFVAALFAISVASGALAQSAPVVSGTVQKVDAATQKITLKHQAIPNLDMGAMTMVFKAAEKDMTSKVKSGDKVQFTADRVNGQLTVTTIKKTK